MDLSQVLSKPIIVIQTSENVTKLIGALLRYGTLIFTCCNSVLKQVFSGFN